MANEIYDSTWWGNTIDTASSIGTSTDMIQGQFNLTKIGDEKVVNGDFATDTDWDKLSGSTINNGQANLVFNGSGNPGVKQNIPIIQGKKYKIVFNVSRWTSGNFQIFVSSDTRSGFVILNGVGEYEVILEINTVGEVRLIGSGATSDFSIDNASLKEVRATSVESVKCLADAIHRIGIQNIKN